SKTKHLIIVQSGAAASEESNWSMKEGGSLVDAAIATEICINFINAFSVGIGG
ncbi:3427_t:CDS:2, partial [Entrophospora sp. SA101]